jgi:IS30 family transposase
MTLVDRRERFLLGKKLDGHCAENLQESICGSLKALPYRKLTVDNGKGLAAHKAITAESRVPVYFALLHSPLERPTSENTNRLFRQFLPKDTSSLTVTQEHLDHTIHLLHNCPRKHLTGKNPHQPFAEDLLYLA